MMFGGDSTNFTFPSTNSSKMGFSHDIHYNSSNPNNTMSLMGGLSSGHAGNSSPVGNHSMYPTGGALGSHPALQTLRHLIKTVLVPAICILGVIGNALTLLVLTRKRLQSSCDGTERTVHIGLFSLAMSDLLCCICLFPHGFLKENQFNFSSVNFQLVYKTYGEVFINTFILTSTWLTVTMATSRYLAICHPFRARHMIGLTGTRVTILLVFFISILFNIPRFFNYRIESIQCDDGRNIFLSNTWFMNSGNSGLRTAYIWAYFSVGIFLPLVMLAFCNICLVKALRESTKLRRRYRVPAAHVDSNHRITSILVTIVVMYILFVSPAEILLFVRERLHQPEDGDYQELSTAVELTNILQTINFACDFVLYFVLNVHFRQALREMFYSVISKLFGCKDPKAKSRKTGRLALYSQASISRNTTTLQTLV